MNRQIDYVEERYGPDSFTITRLDEPLPTIQQYMSEQKGVWRIDRINKAYALVSFVDVAAPRLLLFLHTQQ